MAKYKGLRVIQLPRLGKEPNVFIGTVIYDTKFNNHDDTVFVQWDCGNNHKCAIGYSEKKEGIGYQKKYDLLSYDNVYKGEIHDGFSCLCRNGNIIGTMWCCLNCPNVYMCTSCCMETTCHEDHNICRFDSPNKVGYFVGKLEKCDIYRGIVRGSFVKNTETSITPFKGKVESIEFLLNRLIIKVNSISGETKKWRRYEKLKLENSDEKKVTIDKNHLRILGHNPVFNCELYLHYKDQLDTFVSEFSNDEIDCEIGDTVHVDCFSPQDFIEFQKGFGEYNNKIEKLIGERGTVTQVDKSVIRVHYQTIDEDISLNSASIFNCRNTEHSLIRVSTNKNHLEERIKNWVEKLDDKGSSKRWHPDDSLLEMIKGRLGVIVTRGLPDNLVVVKFKLHRCPFCILLPETVCDRLDEPSKVTSAHVTLEDINLCEDELLEFERGKKEIESNNYEFFENEVVCLTDSLWSALFHEAVERKNTDIMKIMITKASSQSIVNKYLLKMLTRSTEWTSVIEDTLLASVTLDFDMINWNGDNLVHLASKNGYCSFLEKVLSNERYNMAINKKNSKTGLTAFHYAVQNDMGNVVRVLIKNRCDIYAKSSDDSTGLHIALRHYYFDALLAILELRNDDLDVDISNSDSDTVLHLAAARPDEDMLKRWNNIIASDKKNELTNLVDALDDFKKVYENCRDIDVKTTPCFILSCLILNKSKNANSVWNNNYNKQGSTPSKVLSQSIKKDNNSASNTILLRLFKRYQNKSGKMEMCQFCKADFAVVLYLPCRHKLYCEHCSFMPDRCGKCSVLIERKCIDGIDIKHFDDWNNSATTLFDIKCPENMSDWFELVLKMLQQRQCQCCKMNSITFVIRCGHGICKDCCDKSTVCPTCQMQIIDKIEMKSFDLKEY